MCFSGGSGSAVMCWLEPLHLQGEACGDGGLVVWRVFRSSCSVFGVQLGGCACVGTGWGLLWWSGVYFSLFLSLLPPDVQPAERKETAGGAVG